MLIRRCEFNAMLKVNEDGTYQEGTGTIGGWDKSKLRLHLKENIKPLIQDGVRRRIVEVEKSQPAYDTSGNYFYRLHRMIFG